MLMKINSFQQIGEGFKKNLQVLQLFSAALELTLDVLGPSHYQAEWMIEVKPSANILEIQIKMHE